MPIYEYKCDDCNEVFEVLVSSCDCATVNCPGCGSENTNKLFSSFAATSPGNSGSGCGGHGGFT